MVRGMEKQKNLHIPPLYREVAKTVTGLIDRGTYRTGDRIPSIRELSKQLKVSINTVKTAYCLLEDQCLIEARPQSGYYVRPRFPELPKEPDIHNHNTAPRPVTTTELVIRIMKDVLNPEMVQFGAAIPAPELIPDIKLNRILGSVTKRYRKTSVDYAIPPGTKFLRTQVAKRILKAGCPLNPEDIVITTGASEAVYLSLRAICKPGDTIAVGTPIYFSFIEMFKELGLRVIEIPSSPTMGMHIEPLRRAIKTNTIHACIVISNFNNPLGNCLPDDRKEELVDLLESYDIPLIEDDINGDLSFSGERPSVAKAWDKSGNVLLCSSFSKTLAPGYRVGWVAPGKFLDKVIHKKLITNIASASPTQLAVAEFLDSGGYDHHLRTIRKAYAAKTAQMTEAIGEYFPHGTRVTRPSGGYAIWVELPHLIDTAALYSKARNLGITIAPGSVFSTTGKFANCLRLNAAFWSETNRTALEGLGKMAAAMQEGQLNKFITE